MDHFYPPKIRHLGRFLFPLLIMTAVQPAVATELTLAVHPVLPAQRTLDVYQPLARYLAEATGHEVKILTTNNFLAHWQMIKRGDYDLVVDGPHFTDYRIKTMGYKVLAKMPEVVSYSLVTHEETMILDPEELIGQKIATTPSPSLGALRLAELFPHPLRQPMIVETGDSEAAATLVLQRRAAGAIIPTALVDRYSSLSIVTTTDQVPAPGLSASPRVPEATQKVIRKALIEAHLSEAGRAALKPLNLGMFEPADANAFENQRKLLEGVWGY